MVSRQVREGQRKRRRFLGRNRATGARGLRIEPLEQRWLLAGELTELNATDWSAWGDQATIATVADDTARTVLGAGSLRFETDGGFDTYVQYPGAADAGWDLTSENYLHVAFYAENNNEGGFQNGSPWIDLVDADGDFFRYRYYQGFGWQDLLNGARGRWRFHQIPLHAPENPEYGWGRTAQGTPDLSDVQYLQIHADTWEYGFTLWIDGLFFSETADPLVVTNTQDDGPGSLRSAMETANTVDYAATIQFRIPPADPGFVDVDSHLLGTDPRADADPDAYVIQPSTPLPALQNYNQGVALDGGTQTLFGGDTNPFGPEIVLDAGLIGQWQSGLQINSSDNLVRGLNICRAPEHGIAIRGDGNRVEGNYIGTDATGTLAARNGNAGILIDGASYNTIGGTAAGAGNVISANGSAGVWILAGQGPTIFQWSGADGNSDRYYVVTPGSTWAEANASAAALGGHLLAVNSQAEQDFLDAEIFARDEFWYESFWTGLNDVATEGSFVWTSGEAVTLTNWGPGEPNGGEWENAVLINNGHNYPENRGYWYDASADQTVRSIVELAALPDWSTLASVLRGGHNVVQGNRIGTDPSGTLDLGNEGTGVLVQSPFNAIGGVQSGAGNLISGNAHDGVGIGGRYALSNVVAGNRIGTDAVGAAALPNEWSGIRISAASENVLGGDVAGAGNMVSGNRGDGISVGGENLPVFYWAPEDGGNGHYYLLSPWSPWREAKAAAAAVGGYLVTVTSAAEQAFLDQHVFSADAYWNDSFWTGLHDHAEEGTFVWSSGETLSFQNWYPGQPDGGIEQNAVVINSGQDYPQHRGQWSDATSGWGSRGIIELETAPDWATVIPLLGGYGNVVLGNLVGTDHTGNHDLGNGAAGVTIDRSGWNTIGGIGEAARNVVSGNDGDGVAFNGSESMGNVLTGNYIGTNAAGTAGLGNAWAGVTANNAPGNVIGRSAAGAGNVISGNGTGISIHGGHAAGTEVQGNLIGTDASGTLPIGNVGSGIQIHNSPRSTIGGSAPGAGNVIAASDSFGITILGFDAGDSVIQGNAIGTNWAGATGLGNQREGVAVSNSPGTRILDNVISANGGGISLYGYYVQLGQWTDPDGDQHYYVLGSQRTWAEAEALAQSIGGHLADITSAEEQRYLQNLLGWYEAWIGLSDVQHEGVFTWTSGNALSYTNWAPGSPQSTGGDYVQINREPSDPERRGRWYDVHDGLARVLIEIVNPADPLAFMSAAAEAFADGGAVIRGNRIGTTPDGSAALGNAYTGIYVGNSSNNVIGLDSQGAGEENLIAANGEDGIRIDQRWSVGNSVRGNLIGTTADGDEALGNAWNGISISLAPGAILGGADADLGNVISGNGWNGVAINGDYYRVAEYGGHYYVVTPRRTWFEAEAAAVALGGHLAAIADAAENAFVASLAQGRYAGTLWIGLTDQAQQDVWQWIDGDTGTYLNWSTDQPDHGGTGDFEHYAAVNQDSTGQWSDWDGRNEFRAVLEFSSPPSSNDLTALFASGHTQVLGNRIGADAAGTVGLSNGWNGVAIDNSQFNTIGGTGEAGNLIGGNQGQGVHVTGPDAGGNVIAGNLIGTDITGTLPLGNGGAGIGLDAAWANTIGGSGPGAGNVIAANGSVGIDVYSVEAPDNVIQGNAIGTNWAGATGLGNQDVGIRVRFSPGTRILGNVISANWGGIGLGGSEHYLGQWTDADGGQHFYVLGPQKTWAEAEALAVSLGGHLADITSAEEQSYLQNLLGWESAWIGLSDVQDEGLFTWTSGEPLSYTNWASGSPQANGGDCGMINREPWHPERRGRWYDVGDTPARALIEVLNPADPLSLLSDAAEVFAGRGAVIQGNRIGTTPDGSAALGNAQVGIYVGNSSNNVIGVDSQGAGQGNVIAANGDDGIRIEHRWSVGNSIRGNRIGTTADGSGSLGNTWNGISVYSPGGAVIGGPEAGQGNLISGNSHGVVIAGDYYQLAEYGGHYYVVTPARTWFEAEAAAVALGGHLATIGDQAENDFAASLAQGQFGGMLWIGLTDQALQDVWAWISGEAGAYANWSTGQPDHGGTGNFEHCALINQDGTGQWSDWDGRNAFRAVLEFTSPPSASDLDALFASGHTQVLGNRIGTDAAGTSPLGNARAGVAISDSQFNTIGGVLPGEANQIAYNAWDGVQVVGPISLANSIRGNAIHGNGDLGIDLNDDGVTPNDPLDSDTGPNQLRNFPELNVLELAPARIAGTATGGPLTALTIDIYVSPVPDGSGHGEGATYLESFQVVTDAVGNAPFDWPLASPLAAGEYVTLTATDAAGNTSEFSPAYLAAGDTLIVTNTADSGPGSLRAVIQAANAVLHDVQIVFQIPVSDGGFVDVDWGLPGGDSDPDVFVIRPLSPLPELNNAAYPVTLDGGTQALFLGQDTNPWGPEIVLDGSSAGSGSGLVVRSDGNRIAGLNIQSFPDSGVFVSGNENVVAGSYLGTDATGTLPRGNGGHGVFIVEGGSANTVGGMRAEDRNIISANGASGVMPWGGEVYNNLILGNYIGTDRTGTVDLGNAHAGVTIQANSGNRVGGPEPGAGNVISGNQWSGVWVATLAPGTIIQGNYIGTDASGTRALGNSTHGIDIQDAPGVTIGGTAAGAGNLISGNTRMGIWLHGTTAVGGVIQGNLIGTNAAATSLLGNGWRGIEVYVASACLIGGTAAGAGNVIAGNAHHGVYIAASAAGHNVVQGNSIGTNRDGTLAGGNGWHGVSIVDSPANTIGGTLPGEANTIAHNAWDGVAVLEPTSVGNSIRGNSIHDNGGLGIDLNDDGVTANDGDDSDSGPNLLQNYPLLTALELGSIRLTGSLRSAANTQFDIDVYASSDADPSGHGEGGRYLGSFQVTTDATGLAAFEELLAASVAGGEFVALTATDPHGNTSEFSRADVVADVTLVVTNTADSGPGSLRQVILDANAASGYAVVRFEIPNTDPGFADVDAALAGGDPEPDAFVIRPLTALPSLNNPNHGIYLDGRTQAAFGGDTNPFGPEIVLDGSGLDRGAQISGLKLVSSRNQVWGLNIQGFPYSGMFIGGSENTLAGNYVGTDATGTADRGNVNDGVLIWDGVANTVGGTSAEQRNVISGNNYNGIRFAGTSRENLVLGNYLGTDAGGNVALGNSSSGVLIWDRCINNVVGGSDPDARNVISGNGEYGVRFVGSEAVGNWVGGNYIGVNVAGTDGLGNGGDGVLLDGAVNTTLGGVAPGEGNTVAYNAGAGIAVVGSASTGNTIRGNAVYGNTRLGIDLNADGVTVNDAGDADAGPNGLQNFPEIETVRSGSFTEVAGTFRSTPSATFVLDFYANADADASGYGEGQRYLGSAVLTTNVVGEAAFDVSSLGSSTPTEYITGTATDSGGNTSEFSASRRTEILTLDVTNTGDSGPGSLRQVILDANAVIGPAAIRFRIPDTDPGFADVDAALPGGDPEPDVFVIRPLTALPSLDNPDHSIYLDGRTQAAWGGDTNPFGPEIVLDGSGLDRGAEVSGLKLVSSRNQVWGLNIQGFPYSGVFIGGSENTLAGNYLGTDATGMLDRGNVYDGVLIWDGVGNTVGGTSAEQRNVISGNDYNGIRLDGTSRDNVVLGNYLGTDAGGNAALGNSSSGILIWDRCIDNVVGGSDPGARNVISGNGEYGVRFVGSEAVGNWVGGNFIGVTAAGTAGLGNGGPGVLLDGAVNATIGGAAAGAGNLISGNGGNGISLYGFATTGIVIQGNYIGTDASGTAGLPNRGDGVLVEGARANLIGGTVAGAGNLISANDWRGIYIGGATAADNQIVGNTIGTDVTGTANLGNRWHGIELIGGRGTTIGGAEAGAGNLVAFNGWSGIEIDNSGENRVLGNTVRDNTQNGINVSGSNNVLGGTVAGAGNVISANGGIGVWVFEATSTGNAIRGNAIYDNAALGIDLGDGGVTANDADDSDTGPNQLQNYPELTGLELGPTRLVGSLRSVANTQFDIDVYASSGADRSGHGEGGRYLGSFQVTTDATGLADFEEVLAIAVAAGEFVTLTATDPGGNTSEFSRAYAAVGARLIVTNTADSGPGSLRQVLSAANGALHDVEIVFNIPDTDPGFLDIDGSLPGGDSEPDVFVIRPLSQLPALNNPDYRLFLNGDSQAAFLGDTNPQGPEIVLDGSVVADYSSGLEIWSDGNRVVNLNIRSFSDAGIWIDGNSNLVAGCYLGTDARGESAMGNYYGIMISGSRNTLGGMAAGARNVISGNRDDGAQVWGGDDNLILGNYLGLDATGNRPLGNGDDGLEVDGGGNTIGGAVPEARNVISGNAEDGITFGDGAMGNAVLGNYIGTNAVGTAGIGNAANGILVTGLTRNHVIGGTGTGMGNVISGNGRQGIEVASMNTIGVHILGNAIGTAADGQTALANGWHGIFVNDSCGHTIGGSAAGAGNVIAGNDGDGILVHSPWDYGDVAGVHEAYVLHRIARTGQAMPEAGSSFTGFSAFPAIEGTWLAFQAAGSDGRQGIYADWGSGLQRVVDTGAAVPDSTAAFTRFGDRVAVTSDSLVFWAEDTSGTTGIYVWEAGALRKVVDSLTPLPGGQGRFVEFGQPSIGESWDDPDGAGLISFFARDDSGKPGIYAERTFFEADVKHVELLTLFDTNTAIPGGTGSFVGFGEFPATVDYDMTYVIGDGPDGQTGIYRSYLWSGQIYRYLIADTHDSPVGESATFVSFQDVQRGQSLRFLAELSDGRQGLYIGARYSGFTAIADTQTPVPDGAGNFADFRAPVGGPANTFYTSADIFSGTDATDQEGLYWAVGDELWPVINTNDAIEDLAIVDLSIGGQALGGASVENISRTTENGLLFWAQLEDGSQALYLASRQTGNVIQGNWIGTSRGGNLELANAGAGLHIDGAAHVSVAGGEPSAGNTIAFNAGAGVLVEGDGALGNAIRGNAVRENGALGIDLGGDGVTTNDGLDADAGPNGLQNFPVLQSVIPGDSPRIAGRLESLANEDFTIDFYASAAADPSGRGEGGRYLGSAAVSTDALGTVSFAATLAGASVQPDEWITAAATCAATGDTSEFSAALPADPGTLIVTRFVPTRTGFVSQFNRDLEPSVLNLYDSAAHLLGPADVSVRGATVGAVRGSLVLSADRREITFVQTGGLLEPDTYTVMLFSGATRFREPSGGALDGNADGTPGDDYQTTFTVAARPAGTVTISLPDFARGAGQPVNIPNTATGLPIRLDNADGVTSLAADLRYDPALLSITGAELASGLPTGWSVGLDTSTPGVARVTAVGTTPLSGTNIDVVRLTAAVPNGAPYGAIQAVQLENVSLNGGAIAALGDVALHKAAYLGDADGSGIHSSADAFLTVQAALGLASGFAAHAWTDPRIVGDADGSGMLSAADAFLIVQEGLGLSEPFVPDNPHITVTPVGGGVDPQFQIDVNLVPSAGGWVSVPVKLDIEPAATNVGAFDFDVFFDPARLTIQLPGGVSAGADTAGWAVAARLVASGQLRVGMVSSNGQPLAVGLREIARLQFRVEAGKSSRTGWQSVPDGLPTRPTLLRPITDTSDGSETHPTLLDIEPVDAHAGGYAWTAADGSVLIRPAERALAAAARQRIWCDMDAKADLVDSVLADLVPEIASARR